MTSSRVHLVGGGVEGIVPELVLASFGAEAVAHARRRGGRPRLLLVLADDAGRAKEFRPSYVDALESVVGDFVGVDAWITPTSSLDLAALRDVDGIVVGGGPTPVYRQALVGVASEFAAVVAGGVPYLGFSAGAMVAADRAIVGGWRDHGRAVCHEDWSEGLAELTIEPGLALVDLTVDVHAAQGGLLGRASAAACRADVGRAVAIDEGTCLSVPLGSQMEQWQVAGSGFVWVIDAAEDRSQIVRRLAG